ncbi:MAG TPA: deoxyribonuclease IV [Firmicutes bacterium]|nr:deoxyribonuclease IV [Candidatus Fermentithermobacillaceae bacterium]
MRFGVHLSIQGGMEKMARAAIGLGCETVQVFSRSPRGGKAKPLVPGDVARMKQLLQEHDIGPLVVHAPYFINLASTEESKRAYSIQVLAEDLLRAEVLGAGFVVTHIGHKRPDEPSNGEQALSRTIDSLNEILDMYSGPVKLLLENTSGQGQEIGSTFEALGKLVHVFPLDRVGTCFDTCHAFGQGYDLSDPYRAGEILQAYDRILGLETLEVIHLNDSKMGLGSHRDRHQHVGKGLIGLEGFKEIINDPRLKPGIPGIMETPNDSPTADEDNLSTARALRLARTTGAETGHVKE